VSGDLTLPSKWGCDRAERLTMVVEVRNLNANKLFKIVKLNMRGRANEWFNKLNLAPIDRT